MPHLSLPLAVKAALRYEKDLIDGDSDGHCLRNRKNSRHGLAGRDPRIGMALHRRNVVGEENSPFFCGPFENSGIGRTRQADILYAHNIEFW